MTAPQPTPDQKLRLAAITDRLIYGDEKTFQAADAIELLAMLPKKWIPIGRFKLVSQTSGGSMTGHAAGVGDVKIEDKDKKTHSFDTDSFFMVRAGQWKFIRRTWLWQPEVEIEQMLSTGGEESKAAVIRYDRKGKPTVMDIQAERSFHIPYSPLTVSLPYWVEWKKPV